MNRKLLIMLIVSLLAIGLVGGATMAVFTAEGSNDNNVFKAGTLIIGADGEGVNEGNIILGNAAPGDSESSTIEVKNLGTLPFSYTVTATPGDDNDADLYDVLQLTVTNPDGVIFENLPISELHNEPFGNLDSLESEDFTFTVSFPMGLDIDYNALMNLTASIDFTFNASQVEASVSLLPVIEVVGKTNNSVKLLVKDQNGVPMEGVQLREREGNELSQHHRISYSGVSFALTGADGKTAAVYNGLDVNASGVLGNEYSQIVVYEVVPPTGDPISVRVTVWGAWFTDTSKIINVEAL